LAAAVVGGKSCTTLTEDLLFLDFYDYQHRRGTIFSTRSGFNFDLVASFRISLALVPFQTCFSFFFFGCFIGLETSETTLGQLGDNLEYTHGPFLSFSFFVFFYRATGQSSIGIRCLAQYLRA